MYIICSILKIYIQQQKTCTYIINIFLIYRKKYIFVGKFHANVLKQYVHSYLRIHTHRHRHCYVTGCVLMQLNQYFDGGRALFCVHCFHHQTLFGIINIKNIIATNTTLWYIKNIHNTTFWYNISKILFHYFWYIYIKNITVINATFCYNILKTFHNTKTIITTMPSLSTVC